VFDYNVAFICLYFMQTHISNTYCLLLIIDYKSNENERFLVYLF